MIGPEKIGGSQAAEQIATAAAARLRETNRLLSIAEGLANFGHWRIEPGDQNVEFSAQAGVIAGLGRNDRLAVQDAIGLVHPDDRKRILCCIAAARRGLPNASCQVRLQPCSGLLKRVVIQAQADTRPDGRIAGLFGVISDVTAEVAAEEALVAARDLAEAATRAKSEFLATMSHEIRTPMTGVLGMIDLLCGAPGEAEREQYLAATKESAQSLMGVLDGILDFSKVEAGRIELDSNDFDFEALAQRLVVMFGQAASRKGLEFDLRINSGRSPIVRGDSLRIQQVITNLVSNAVKFTATGKVTLSLEAQPRAGDRQLWRVAIEDTGGGLDEAAIGRLYQPFVQLGNQRGNGTGLGLAISHRLVEAMGGRSGASSTPGAGSTFWFELELPIGDPQQVQASPEAPTTTAVTHMLHVLVVEDNPINRMLITALVRRFGHRVTCADNGRRGAEAAQAVPFDCILMDMQMPEMDGVAATRAIRRSGGSNAVVPIIALTADAAPERRRNYDGVGLTDFMTKPIDAAALQARLTAIAATVSLGDIRPAPAGPTLCREQLDELRATLGEEKLHTLLTMLLGELEQRPRTIRRLAGADDMVALRSEAHNFKGSVASFGLVQLARAAKAIELALPGAELEFALSRLDAETARARIAIGEVVPPPSLPIRASA